MFEALFNMKRQYLVFYDNLAPYFTLQIYRLLSCEMNVCVCVFSIGILYGQSMSIIGSVLPIRIISEL